MVGAVPRGWDPCHPCHPAQSLSSMVTCRCSCKPSTAQRDGPAHLARLHAHLETAVDRGPKGISLRSTGKNSFSPEEDQP